MGRKAMGLKPFPKGHDCQVAETGDFLSLVFYTDPRPGRVFIYTARVWHERKKVKDSFGK
jgi:hypothetical protein